MFMYKPIASFQLYHQLVWCSAILTHSSSSYHHISSASPTPPYIRTYEVCVRLWIQRTYAVGLHTTTTICAISSVSSLSPILDTHTNKHTFWLLWSLFAWGLRPLITRKRLSELERKWSPVSGELAKQNERVSRRWRRQRQRPSWDQDEVGLVKRRRRNSRSLTSGRTFSLLVGRCTYIYVRTKYICKYEHVRKPHTLRLKPSLWRASYS